MIVDSKYESNTWRIMAIDMWQRSRRNPTTKNDTSSKYLNLIYTLLCHVERERSEDTFTCFQRCSSNLSTSISMLSMQQPFLVYLLVLVKNTNTSAKSIEYASMLSGEVAYTSDIEIRTRYNVQRATWTMMMVTASSHYIKVQFLPLQWINLQLVTYHMFFVSKRANSYVKSLYIFSVHYQWNNIDLTLFPRAFTSKRDIYVSTEILANQSWWMRIQVRTCGTVWRFSFNTRIEPDTYWFTRERMFLFKIVTFALDTNTNAKNSLESDSRSVQSQDGFTSPSSL